MRRLKTHIRFTEYSGYDPEISGEYSIQALTAAHIHRQELTPLALTLNSNHLKRMNMKNLNIYLLLRV
jgi:hypothetical protein